ncbi:unnamed protein product, partial [Brenthis ino]
MTSEFVGTLPTEVLCRSRPQLPWGCSNDPLCYPQEYNRKSVLSNACKSRSVARTYIAITALNRSARYNENFSITKSSYYVDYSLDRVSQTNKETGLRVGSYMWAITEAALDTVQYMDLEIPEEITSLIHPENYTKVATSMFRKFGDSSLATNTNWSMSVEAAMTEMGMCHVINSNVAKYDNPRKWNEMTAYVKNNVELSVFEVDFYAQLTNYAPVYKVFIHSPDEITTSTTSTFTVDVEGKHERICHINELKCVRYYRKEIISLRPSEKTLKKFNYAKDLPRTSSDCGCLSTCELDLYYKDNEDYIPKTPLNQLKIKITSFPKVRVVRDIIFNYYDILRK